MELYLIIGLIITLAGAAFMSRGLSLEANIAYFLAGPVFIYRYIIIEEWPSLILSVVFCILAAYGTVNLGLKKKRGK